MIHSLAFEGLAATQSQLRLHGERLNLEMCDQGLVQYNPHMLLYIGGSPFCFRTSIAELNPNPPAHISMQSVKQNKNALFPVGQLCCRNDDVSVQPTASHLLHR